MKLNIEVTREDYGRFMKFWYVKFRLKKSFIFITIFSLIFALVLVDFSTKTFVDYIIVVLMLMILYGIILFLTMNFSLKRSGKLLQENGTVLGSKKIEILEQGIQESSENSTTIFKWQSIKEVTSDEHAIYIFVDKVAAIIIPKRYITDVTQQEVLLATVEKYKTNQ
jgi:hypothetical protein